MQTTSSSVWKRLALVAGFALLPTGVAAEGQCDQRDKVIGHLAERFNEAPVALGVTTSGHLVEVLSTGDGTSWTIVVSTGDGMSCMVAAGRSWRVKPNDGVPADPEA